MIYPMQKQKVTHKVVADCMEALIGAHYIAGGERGASDYMRHIGLLPQMPKTARLIPGPDRKADSPSARYAAHSEALLIRSSCAQ